MRFDIDGMGPSIEAVGQAPDWNGQAVPIVTAAQVREYAEAIGGRVRVRTGAITLHFADADGEPDCDTWPMRRDGTYELTGWTWTELETSP